MSLTRAKYVPMYVLVWKENERYIKRAAEVQQLPINEIMRRILADAESRGLFLTDDCFSATVPAAKEAA